MRKYITIFKAELMTNLQYLSNIMMGFVSYFTIILIFLYLWDYMYDDPSELINGYSKSQMIWYVIVTEILWKLFDGRRLCRRISEDVKGGNIAYNMNKPYSYIGYMLSSHLAGVAIKAVAFIAFGMILGRIALGSFPNLSAIGIIFVLLSSTFAIIIDLFLTMTIGLFCFYIEEATPIYWLYLKIILIFGTMFPVEFFPSTWQGIIRLSPVYVVCYGPAKLFVNFSIQSAMHIIMAQILYVVFACGLCTLLYTKGVRKLNGNGG